MNAQRSDLYLRQPKIVGILNRPIDISEIAVKFSMGPGDDIFNDRFRGWRHSGGFGGSRNRGGRRRGWRWIG